MQETIHIIVETLKFRLDTLKKDMPDPVCYPIAWERQRAKIEEVEDLIKAFSEA